MAGCTDYGCNCLIQGEGGILVEGAGTPGSPYKVSLVGGLGDALTIEDTPTVNLTLNGGGTPADPYVLSAQSTMALTQLSDVADPQGGPQVGESPVWVGTGPTAHWEFSLPPANPSGSVNVSTGLAGLGSVGDPLRVKLIGTTAGGPTSGLEVYADSAGNLRAVAGSGSVAWTSVTGKPTTFPTTPSDFTGTLPVNKGGTGATDLANVTVGNATRVGGIRIYVQSTTPTGMSTNDLWFWGS